MNDVMIDIETLGTSQNAVILSVGAVLFNQSTGEIHRTFYAKLDAGYQMHHLKRCIEIETLVFWLKQPAAFEGLLTEVGSPFLSMKRFSHFFNAVHNMKNLTVWGNGSSFDLGLLVNLFNQLKIELPWKYWQERDVRTVVDLGRTLLGIDPKKTMPFEGTQHNALDDALHQAKYVSHIIRQLKEATKTNKEKPCS